MPQVSIQVIGEPPSDTQRAAAFAEITDLKWTCWAARESSSWS